jgi:aryl-alcohol dehydrogenase-like predicted oxidoreductase
MKALGIADRAGSSRFVSQQIYYSLQAREAEYELMPATLDQGLGVLVWSPLAGGLLSGKYRRGKPMPEGRTSRTGASRRSTTRRSSTTRSRCWSAIAEAQACRPSQVALAWSLGRPGITSLVIGARNEQQLKQNCQRRAEADPGRARQARRGQRAHPALPVLAPGQHGPRPPRRRGLALLAPFVKGEARF